MFKQFLAVLLVPTGLMAQTFHCGGPGGGRSEILTATSQYDRNSAGFDFGTVPESVSDTGCSSNTTLLLSFPEPEGDYTITVEFGGAAAAKTTVRAEARRLMVDILNTKADEYISKSFTVEVRRPVIHGDKPIELFKNVPSSLDWDDKLTLEFAGVHPSFRKIEIRPADPGTPTIYLAGDSTVTDQDHEPWAAWGQMIPAFFGPGVVVANYAESGKTVRSFEQQNRFAKIFSMIKAGDYLFLQFGHNDQKPGKGYVPPDEYTELLAKYVAMARERGATPILVTSMNRRVYDEAGHIQNTLAPYPQLVRDLASREHVGLIDLNAMSKTLFEAVGEEKSRSLFVYAAADTYPNQKEALHDDTHFNDYGAYELAKCVVLGIERLHLPLVEYLRSPREHFDPRHPDTLQSVALPPAPFVDIKKPAER